MFQIVKYMYMTKIMPPTIHIDALILYWFCRLPNNDSFEVGAGTITITNAFFLGSILETLGSVFLSGEVGIVILPFLSFFIVIKHHATISFYAYQVQVFCKKYKIKYNIFRFVVMVFSQGCGNRGRAKECH